MRDGEIAILVLAGGAATRLPQKLRRDVGGATLLERVLHNVESAPNARYVCAGPSDAAIESAAAAYGASVLYDGTPGAGPLAALVSACASVAEPWIFALAGDAPYVTASVLADLSAARESGDEAVVPLHGSRREPLAALYERRALARAGAAALEGGDASMHAALERMRVRTVPMDARHFLNVNTPDDLHEARTRILLETP